MGADGDCRVLGFAALTANLRGCMRVRGNPGGDRGRDGRSYGFVGYPTSVGEWRAWVGAMRPHPHPRPPLEGEGMVSGDRLASGRD